MDQNWFTSNSVGRPPNDATGRGRRWFTCQHSTELNLDHAASPPNRNDGKNALAKANIIRGDSKDILPRIATNSIDSIITDPPYGIQFFNREWDDNLPPVQTWRECFRVLKPGGHLLAFGATRTFHRLWSTIEDAEFQIRDTLMWIFGSGFPKSKNVAVMLDKKLGHPDRGHRIAVASRHHPDGTREPNGERLGPYVAKSLEAKPWEGWGTGLKPAFEPILVARKPLVGTIAENVLRHGVGGLAIDPCRVEGGRWPANVMHDGSPEVVSAFGKFGDNSTAARFFYSPKVSRKERQGSAHPTMKPRALMTWLCTLVTPPGGKVLDPFAGSGTTGEAACRAGFDAVLIEREPEYIDLMRHRLAQFIE